MTPQTDEKPKARVFINYRREDGAGYAGSLHRWLSKKSHLGRGTVFMDVSAIEGGEDFAKAIERVVTTCDAMVVLIGPEWLDCYRRRLDHPPDYVRLEIALALSHEKHVIPVLLGSATLPRPEDLPKDLEPLVRRQVLPLTNERWDYDAGLLLATLKRKLGLVDVPKTDPSWSQRLLRWLRHNWEQFPAPLVAGLLVLTAALALQVHLAYRPEPVSLEATGMFSAAAARLGREMLTIEAPSLDAGGLLLAHVANANEIVDLGFERARLDGNTLMQFSEQNPPTSPSRVDFMTTKPGAAAAGEPCRTFIEVRAADPHRPPSALHFYQQHAPGGDILRALEVKADGDLLVGVNTDMPDESDEGAPGCTKLLKVAPDFASPVSGISAINVIAEAASAARFSFNPATAKNTLFDGAEGLFEPFAFGNDAPAALRASAVEIVSLGGAGGPAHVLGARSVVGGEPLSVESISVGSDRLLVRVSGVGFVQVNGKDFADPRGRIERHPFISLLFVMADTVLLAWLLHRLFDRRPSFMR
jgi:hypothetical protein